RGTEQPLERPSRCLCQLPDRKHADLGQTRLGDRAHSPHQLDGQVVKEFKFGVGIDNHQPVRLGHLRGNFRQMLCARHADRDRKAKLRPHAAPDCSRNFGRRTEEMGAPSDVGKGLVDGNPLDEGREIVDHLDGGIAQPLVVLEVAVDKSELRTELARLPSRHAAADSLTAEDLLNCGQKWLARFTPFFTERERKQAGCQHRLFCSQIEYCDNLIFRRRAALDKLGERLLDANRTIARPNKITVIFGRKISKHYRGKLQTEIEDMNLPNPVIRSHYRNGFIKQYVRDHVILRTEPASNNVTDYGVNKAIEHLPALRDKIAAVIDNYLDVQQDILETF